MRTGTENNLTQAQRWALVMGVQRMIWQFIRRRIWLKGDEGDQARQNLYDVCLDKVYRAAELYQGERAQFTTYASYWLRAAWTAYQNEKILPIADLEQDWIPAPANEAEPECYDDLHRAMEQLTGRQRRVLLRRFGGDETFAEIGRVFKVTRVAVRASQKQALVKLRSLLCA